MSRPNAFTGEAVPVRRRPSNAEFFLICLDAAVERIQEAAPAALSRIDVGAEDVPVPDASWAAHRVPLAAALEATPERHGQIVLFRRPLELRSHTRRELRLLVFRTVVEQLSAISGYTVEMLDPKGITREE